MPQSSDYLSEITINKYDISLIANQKIPLIILSITKINEKHFLAISIFYITVPVITKITNNETLRNSRKAKYFIRFADAMRTYILVQ